MNPALMVPQGTEKTMFASERRNLLIHFEAKKIFLLPLAKTVESRV